MHLISLTRFFCYFRPRLLNPHQDIMANHGAPKQNNVFLWFIAPLAVFVTLLFVKVNANAVKPKEHGAGDRPAHKTEAPAAHQEAAMPHDTTHVAAGDTTHHEAAAAEAPAHH